LRKVEGRKGLGGSRREPLWVRRKKRDESGRVRAGEREFTGGRVDVSYI